MLRPYGTMIAALFLSLILTACGDSSTVPPTARSRVAQIVESRQVMINSDVSLNREATPTAALVIRDGNVRTRPTTQDSNIIDQIGAGETVLLRMRRSDSQWYAIVTPRGTLGWAWVELLSFDPAAVANLPISMPEPDVQRTPVISDKQANRATTDAVITEQGSKASSSTR